MNVTTIYDQIYKKSEPYWDTRQNDVHLPLVYDFAKKLLTFYPEAEAGVVLPAILLHDNGWKMIPPERQAKAFGPKESDFEAKRLHEIEGVRIAAEILASLEYDAEKTKEILAIIDGHDTRLEALSLNDKLVKDADKLWRFTAIGLDIDHRRFGIPLPEYRAWLGEQIEGWFFTDEARRMAGELLGIPISL